MKSFVALVGNAKLMLNGANAKGDVASTKPPQGVLTHLLL